MRILLTLVCLASLGAEPATQSATDDRSPGASVQKLEQRRDELSREAERVRDLLGKLREEVRAQTGRMGTSPQTFRENMARLDQDKQSLEIDLAGLEARRDALANAIAEQTVRLKELVKNDAIVAELEKVEKARIEHVGRLRQLAQAGQASVSDLSAAEAVAAEARAKLLERQEIIANRAGGDQVAAWNRELLNLSIDLVEKRARTEYIAARLGSFLKVDALLSKEERVRDELEHVEQMLRSTREQLEDERVRGAR